MLFIRRLSVAKLRFPAAESFQRSEAAFSGGWKCLFAVRVLHILSGSLFPKHGNYACLVTIVVATTVAIIYFAAPQVMLTPVTATTEITV